MSYDTRGAFLVSLMKVTAHVSQDKMFAVKSRASAWLELDSFYFGSNIRLHRSNAGD
jgi:hypothetical protein